MQCYSRYSQGQKKNVVFFLEIGRVKIFLSLTRLRSRMCIGIYIFNFKKQVKSKKNRRIQKKVKETKEGNRISTENRLKSKKIFVTRISGNKSIFFWGLIMKW